MKENTRKSQEQTLKKDRDFYRGVFLVVGILIGIKLVTSSFFDDFSSIEVAFYITMIFFMLYFALAVHNAIHEIGHLCFGLLTGYKFLAIVTSGFCWVNDKGKIKFKMDMINRAGGYCMMSAPEMENGAIPFQLLQYGGIIANAITAILFFVIHLFFEDNRIASMIFYMLSIVGIAGILLNGIPRKTLNLFNDGYNVKSLKESKEAVSAFFLQTRMNEQMVKGVRFKDMPDEWFEVFSDGDFNNNVIASMAVVRLSRLIDQHLFSEAEKQIEWILNSDMNITELNRHIIISNRIYIEMINQNRIDVIDEMLDKEQVDFMEQIKNSAAVARVKYAYALLVKDDELDASKHKKEFDKIAASSLFPALINSELGLIDIVDEVYQKKAQQIDQLTI